MNWCGPVLMASVLLPMLQGCSGSSNESSAAATNATPSGKAPDNICNKLDADGGASLEVRVK